MFTTHYDDEISIGSTEPCGEDCPQVGEPDYHTRARENGKRFIATLRFMFGPEPEGAALRIRSNPHDFGSYLDVVCRFDSANEIATRYAYRCEADAPEQWLPFKRLCAWCGVLLSDGPAYPISHGCCVPCVEAARAQFLGSILDVTPADATSRHEVVFLDRNNRRRVLAAGALAECDAALAEFVQRRKAEGYTVRDLDARYVNLPHRRFQLYAPETVLVLRDEPLLSGLATIQRVRA